jgi:aryl-alcohol dehydrogenase-like predicted oxidoreductase
MMKASKLGPLQVSALGLGCGSFSSVYGKADDFESLKTLDFALNNGVTFFDTADYYGLGHNEEILGHAIKGRRENAVIGTKFGMRKTGGSLVIDGHPDYLKRACDESLVRLGVDYIDLYYMHRVDRNVPIEDSVGGMADLVAAGKVRALGLCEVSASTLRRAFAVHPIAALQSEYSLWSRDIEDEILPACRDLGVGLVPFAPLGRGLLSGALTSTDAIGQDDYRTPLPRFQPEAFASNKVMIDALAAWAKPRGWTSAQLALAWLMSQGDDVVPIPATRKSGRLRENLGAVEMSLTSADIQEIETICPRGAAAGDRTTPSLLAYSES